MKKPIWLGILCLGLALCASAQPSPKAIEDHFAVVKQTPDDARRIIVNIYLKNNAQQAQKGSLQVSLLGPGAKIPETAFEVNLPAGKQEIYPKPVTLPAEGNYTVRYRYTGADGTAIDSSFAWKTDPVNFFYSFGTPHRMTAALPDNSGKTLLDVTPGRFQMGWTYSDLLFLPYASFKEIKHDWEVYMQPQVNGKPMPQSSWGRYDGWMPVLVNRHESPEVALTLEAVGAREATVVKITLKNKSAGMQQVLLPWITNSVWRGPNPGWIDPSIPADHLVAGWTAPADQLLVLGLGADSYPLDPKSERRMNMALELKPGETRTAWVVRPYNLFSPDLDRLRSTDWESEFNSGILTWENLLQQAPRLILPDQGVVNAYYSALSDFFIMREPIGKGDYIATVPGTDQYRSGPNSYESAIATVALSQAGLYKQAEAGYRLNWDLQEPDGDWTEPRGWSHLMWATTGFKAWAATEYFRNSRDTAYYEKRYRQMLAASRWQDKMRERTRVLENGQKPLTYGLMPVGMGDGGLKNGDSNYGIFYTHNIWATYADSLAWSAARLLGRTQEAAELKDIYLRAKADLMTAMERGAIVDPDGTRWLSGLPGKVSGSCWGLLNSINPTGLLDPENELMTNVLKRVEAKLSPGGVPVHTGWMVDGMWVAIALNDFAQAHLSRDEADEAVAYLYAVLNHGTPLYSWCEERGQFPGTHQITGDLQHLWTPIAVTRYIRDMMVMEQGSTLHLARGIARGWLASGQEVGIEGASSHFGKVSYRMHYDAKRGRLVGQIDFPDSPEAFETILHTLLPENMKVVKTTAGTLLPDGKGIRFTPSKGTIRFEATVKKL